MHDRNIFLLMVLLIIASFIVSCNQYTRNVEETTQASERIVKAKGTIQFIELEGGFFGIIADDGSKYMPINLSKPYQKDSLKIRFEGKVRPDLLGIHMWGKYIEILKIKEL